MSAVIDAMQSLPDNIEGLRALVITLMAERESALSERDALAEQNDRIRHLLLKLKAHAVRCQIRASAGGAVAARPRNAGAGDRPR